MSTRVGDRLDDALLDRLSGARADGPVHEAVLVATVDERGRPHPALLGPGEILAVDPTRLRLAVPAASTTARNLAARGAVTLCLIAPAGVAYVKAAARPLPAEPFLAGQGLAAFEVHIEDVLADAPAASEAARLATGITFTTDDPAFSRDRAARLDALRRA